MWKSAAASTSLSSVLDGVHFRVEFLRHVLQLLQLLRLGFQFLDTHLCSSFQISEGWRPCLTIVLGYERHSQGRPAQRFRVIVLTPSL